jgi:Histidine kinase/Tetratricopeptide repeat
MKFLWLIPLLVPVLSRSQGLAINSLRKLLPSLTDSNRIDCLNKLSVEYYINALPETYYNVQTDSAISFASKAHAEAIKIKYTKGVADALQNLGEIARDRGDYKTAEHYFRQSVPLFEKIDAREKYSWANLTLGWSLHRQGKFADAKLAYERSMPYYLLVNNKERQSMLLRLISYTYGERGYNEMAFEDMQKAIRITYKIRDARGVISSPENMGNFYKDAGEPETALVYLRIAAQNAKGNNPVRYNRILGNIYGLLNKPDSAIFYYSASHKYVNLSTTDTIIRNRDLSHIAVAIGRVYLKQQKYDSAIRQFIIPLQFYERGNDRNGIMVVLRGLATCYQYQQNFTSCFLNAKRLLEMAQASGARPFVRDAYELYWKMYDRQGQIDSAYKYNLKYTAIRDSIITDEYRRNLALSEMRSQDDQQKSKISLLQKDQQISKEQLSLQQQKLKSESFIRYSLIATTAALALIGVFFFRYINLKRKNEQQYLKHELALHQLESQKNSIKFRQQATELEMQALRAQMNPHFIFNCLSSINRFILINKTEEASDYLTKFSRLIRMALHNSEKPLISLDHELEALRLYLDLERLRFKNAFDYSISFVNAIDTNGVYIPPMLIQPFVENAIWHGLMHKKGPGNLDIQFCAVEKSLTCTIIDNGIGRNMAAAYSSRSAEKNKSMGVEITASRLALLSQSTNETAVFNIEDMFDEQGKGCGTRVVLKMHYKALTEVVA